MLINESLSVLVIGLHGGWRYCCYLHERALTGQHLFGFMFRLHHACMHMYIHTYR
jgi:hypothetical protein